MVAEGARLVRHIAIARTEGRLDQLFAPGNHSVDNEYFGVFGSKQRERLQSGGMRFMSGRGGAVGGQGRRAPMESRDVGGVAGSEVV